MLSRFITYIVNCMYKYLYYLNINRCVLIQRDYKNALVLLNLTETKENKYFSTNTIIENYDTCS